MHSRAHQPTTRPASVTPDTVGTPAWIQQQVRLKGARCGTTVKVARSVDPLLVSDLALTTNPRHIPRHHTADRQQRTTPAVNTTPRHPLGQQALDTSSRHTNESLVRAQAKDTCVVPVAEVRLFAGCLTCQQQVSVSQGRICSCNFTCCHTDIEVADQTFYLTQSQC